MTVGFYHAAPTVTPHVAFAERLIASVRQAMPSVAIWQFTDLETPAIAGVDRVDRHQRPSAVALARMQSYVRPGDWLFVDTDVIVQRDVRHVFDQSFDVAVATREGTLKPTEVGTKFMAAMPYNLGAVFSRCAWFWAKAVERMAGYSATRQHWMGDQQALNDTIRDGGFAVAVLSNAYNYPPASREEDVRDKAILHFKGPRKTWMGAA